MKSTTILASVNERKYPVTELVSPKPLINHDGKGPYGDFGNEEKLIEFLETLDDKTFGKLSDLYTVMVKDKGGWLFTDRLYEDRPRTELDKAIYNLRSCRSVHDRKHVVREQLIKLMDEYMGTQEFSRKSPMRIYDLGSGPSNYTVEAFANYLSERDGDLRDFPVRATCIDINPASLRRGRKLAKRSGVSRLIEYKRGRIGAVLKEGKVKEADVLLAIGVICPLSDEITMKLFERAREVLKSGGKFYTCAMRNHPLKNVLNRAGWTLNYREPDKVEKMMKDAGFENIDICFTPEGLFVMALGQKAE